MEIAALILTSGKVERLDDFKRFNVTLGSFNDINFVLGDNVLKFKDQDLKDFNVIYFRFVGKSFEVASLVSNYARKHNIKIIDFVYEDSHLLSSSLGKSLELLRLSGAGLPVPKTVFGNLTKLPFPFVVKSTTGQRAREVWLVNTKEELDKLSVKFEKGKFYFAQELIPSAHRIRVLVVGDRAVGAIVRQTKWNRDETKETLSPIPVNVQELAVKAAVAAGLEVCGVDILTDNRGQMWIIEANAAPSWKLINTYCGVNVEDEIIKYIQG